MPREYKPQGRLLTALEVAEYLQLHYRQVRRLLEGGQIKGYRLPGVSGKPAKLWRVPMSAVVDYMRQGEN